LWISYERAEAIETTNKFDEVIAIYYQVIGKALDIEAWDVVAQSYLSLARVHEAIGRPNDALRNLRQAKKIIDRQDYGAILSRYCVRYASYQRIYESKDTAYIYAHRAIPLGKKYDVSRSRMDGHLILGIIAENIDSVQYHFRSAIAEGLNRQCYNMIGFLSASLSSKLFANRRFQEAQSELYNAFEFSDLVLENNEDYFDLMSRLTSLKSEYFHYNDQSDSAYAYLIKSREFEKKGVYQLDQRAINELEVNFAIKEEEQRANFLEKTNRLLLSGLIAGSIFLILLSILFYKHVRTRKNVRDKNKLISIKNQELEQSVERQALLLSEVHHRVKNNLQLVVGLLGLEYDKNNNLNSDLIDNMSNRIRSISLIHEQLYKEDVYDKIEMQNYLEAMLVNFENVLGKTKILSTMVDAHNVHLNLETVLPIGMICSELVSNTVKHFANDQDVVKIRIIINESNGKFKLVYKDNGKGYPLDKAKRKGTGTQLINSMVRQLKGQAQTYNDQGAIFQLTFHQKTISSV
ncbi:MAG: sensor histidine kinase, partial [Candidatus Thermoplasmatota archaeon]